ncbi:ERG4/ERG24 ergosterol biosynthesis protein [Lophium mytilinum]|uniref:Delta(14)-sterol reductase n=1 Tax=Lophium mytilinum TaxID=390894 RepID=A0A6A6RE30_9PEZI|nr:ERG4/ERG24 ergosterol biosynthesis protein [Lophium mytilinum]
MPPKRKTQVDVEEPYPYEFFGPPGALAVSLGLPLVCYVLAFSCNGVSGCPAPALLHPSTLTLETLKQQVAWPGVSGLLNTKTVFATLGYYLLNLTLYALLPASEVDGTELVSGGRLKYRFNAFSSSIFIMVILAAGTVVEGAEFPVWTFISENYIQLLTTNVLISFFLAVYVYVASFSVRTPNKDMRELAEAGHSGNIIYDWFKGRELNPRITLPLFGEVDIKTFMELRPGLLGWVILDCAFIAQQYRTFGYVTDSILFVTFAQALYVFDSFYMEPAILTTMDITTDGFGFMLSFGDLAWLPFTYSVQTRYLAHYPLELGLWLVPILAVQGLGYVMFRSVNNEKNRFRTNPKDPKISHLKYIQTEVGSKLLITGWWGRARHINYLADWFMSWAFVLPTGIAGYVVKSAFKEPITATQSTAIFDRQVTGRYRVQAEAEGWGMLISYFFILYFAVLLIHRERRDDEKCRRKYGKDWEKYCKIVPYRIVPGIY